MAYGDEKWNQNPMGAGIPPGPATPGKGSGTLGVDYKPWETIDTRIGEAQWQAWEGFRSPNCPPNTPYRYERTDQNGNPIPGCAEKPVDCPAGMTAQGDSKCVPYSGGGGGGQGGPGGGGGGGGAAPGMSPQNASSIAALLGLGSDMSGAISGQLKNILSGAGSRFSPTVVAGLTATNKQAEQSQIARQTAQARESAAARGVLLSPVAQAQENQIVAGAGEQFADSQRQVQLTKAATDFTDKMAALKASQDWLNSLRNYAASLDQNDVQRQGIMANLELGYARIAAETQNLLMQLNSNKELLGMQLDNQTFLEMNRMITCIQMGTC